MAKSMTYADAGVDIAKANTFVENIKTLARQTSRTGVMSEIGGFGGLFSLNTSHYERPVLVSSTDGVGTKLKIAFLTGRHDTVGIDLVAMCINDIVVQGARPLFFLDYLAMGELDTDTATQVVSGIVAGCRQAKCALIGGETAEMPGLYRKGEYDLAGFVVGIVDNDKIVDGSVINMDHKLIGIASSGLHSNGYSLVRKVCFERLGLDVDAHVPELGKTIGEELLTPTKIYSETVHSLLRDLSIHGLAHITGGGIEDNILRVIPKACSINIFQGSWEVPPIFPFLQEAGGIEDREMRRTFNNGIGMIAVVPETSTQEVIERLQVMGEKAWVIGEIVEAVDGQERVKWV